MNVPLIAGAAIALGSWYAGLFMRARALAHLTSEQREQVLAVGTVRRAGRTIFSFGVMLFLVPILILLRLSPPSLNSWPVVLMAIIFGAWLHVSYFRKLRAVGVPAAYVQAHERARYVVYAGFVVAWAVLKIGSRGA
jgi:hypothetical protein